METIITAAATVAVALIGAISAVDLRRKKKADMRSEERALLRMEESRLSMKMMNAAIKLGVATALAVEEKKLNGEMKDARALAAKAQKEYDEFVQKVAANQVAID